MELLCEGYELASLINDCYTIVASNCKKKNLDLYMEIDENLPSIYMEMMSASASCK